MPALNFKKQFAPMVEIGLREPNHPEAKLHTIRAKRKDGRDPVPGQILQLYIGQRTKSCRKLGEIVCRKTTPITIFENYDIMVGERLLTTAEKINLAKADGFKDQVGFYRFFSQTHGLPFEGLIINWDPRL